MKWFINYIHSCFCKHEWELLDKSQVYSNTDDWGRTVEAYRVGTKWTYRCNKCGENKIVKNY